MDLEKTLHRLNENPAVSGFEEEFSKQLKELFEEKLREVSVDKFFNVIGIKRGCGVDRKRIMVSAHYDEIGLIVKMIDDNGFIKFTNIGGIDTKILLAQEVVIHGREKVNGVIGAKPPHLLKEDEAKKSVKMDDMSIDTGLSANRVKEIVSIGDVITVKSCPVSLLNNKTSCKAYDNRAGITALIVVMEELEKLIHRHDVFFVASTQEEVGLRGIITAAYNNQPDLAVVIDACHGDMPETPKEDTYNLGKGPTVGIGPNLHKKHTKVLIDTAKAENIPHQIDVEPGDTGTEAYAVQVSRSGIPTVLISIPVRYMHTPIETLSTEDLRNAGRLTARFISRVETELEGMLCI